MEIVLIIDQDLGFVFWLGQALDAVGYNTLPARGVPEALSLLKELRVNVDILIVPSSLSGAVELAAELRRANKNLRVVALLDEGVDDAKPRRAWDASQPKPRLPDEYFKEAFLYLVQGVSQRLSLTK